MPNATNLGLEDLSLTTALKNDEFYKSLTTHLGREGEFNIFVESFKEAELQLFDKDLVSTLGTMRNITHSQSAANLRQKFGNVENGIMNEVENAKNEEQSDEYKRQKKHLNEMIKRHEERLGSGSKEGNIEISQKLVEQIEELLKKSKQKASAKRTKLGQTRNTKSRHRRNIARRNEEKSATK